ncbi:unnamed protein product [Ixodes persulcatus]
MIRGVIRTRSVESREHNARGGGGGGGGPLGQGSTREMISHLSLTGCPIVQADSQLFADHGRVRFFLVGGQRNPPPHHPKSTEEAPRAPRSV